MERSLARYLRHHRTEGSSEMTLAYHRQTIGGLIAYLRGQGHSLNVDDLTRDDVESWLDWQRERGLSRKTLRTRAVSVKAFTRWLSDPDGGDTLARDPLRKMRPPKVDDIAKPTLTPGEVDKLLAACKIGRGCAPLRNVAILLLLYSTCLRDAELRNLTEGDIDWDQGQILVRRGKGGKFRVVPLGGKAEKALAKYLNHPKRQANSGGFVFTTEAGEPLTHQGLRMLFVRLEGRTGIHCNPHKWRHSGAIQYLRNGGRVEVLQQMLGHTKIDMTLHYARIAGVDVTAAHDTADPARALKTRV